MTGGLFIDNSSRSVSVGEKRLKWPVWLALALAATIATTGYICLRGAALFNPGYGVLDRLLAVCLLLAEGFLFVHALGYFLSTIRAAKGYQVVSGRAFIATAQPHVAVAITSYNEDPAILEETLISATNMNYPNKTVYIADDSTDEKIRQEIQRLAARLGCVYVHREKRSGYKAGNLNHLIRRLPEKYLAVFDADQKPVNTFLSEIIPLLEENPKLAFVQTPQFYANTDKNPVAFAAGQQQAVFYEVVCEGKNLNDALFSAGSNVVYRLEALRDISGFDEVSITEDFATSLKLHLRGWSSLYYNHVFVYGLGPESLSGYFTQQMRWALGTLGVLRRVIASLLRAPRALKPQQWWEYFLSGSYYLIGWVYFVLMLCPLAFLLFNIKPLIMNPAYYAAAFTPHLIISTGTFFAGMAARGYKPKSLFLGQILTFNAFWILMNAAVLALFNVRRPFSVTPKGVSGRVSLKYLLPHLVLLALSVAALGSGVYRLAVAFDPAIIVNIVWASYHIFLLSMVFYFNRSFESYQPKPLFRRLSLKETSLTH